MTLSLRDVKRSLTEQTIVEQALALIKERGFDQVSVRQIAKAAMVSEKTVFNYFPYKELIVLAGVQPQLVAFMDEIQRQIDEITEPTEVLRNFSMNLAELCVANPEAAAIVVGELLTLDRQRLELAMRYIPDPYSPIRTVMTLARAQGKLRFEVGVEYATSLFLSNVLNVIRTHFASGHIDRVRSMLVATLEIFLHGAFQSDLVLTYQTPLVPGEVGAPDARYRDLLSS
jgi:AcrR family transcriptional regulator